MVESPRLKTLGDYRRATQDPFFKRHKPEPYETIREAIELSKWIIDDALCTEKPEGQAWNVLWYPKSEHEMNNLCLFYCIKLMEIAIEYRKVKTIYQLLKNWPKPPDVTANTMAFTSAGISQLDASFCFVCELGRDIIGILKNAYNKHKKEVNIDYIDPFMFLDNTPAVNNLTIYPDPDIIIKTWYTGIDEGVRREFSQYPSQRRRGEFNKIHRQLEYELDIQKSGSNAGGKKTKKKRKPLPKNYFSFGNGQVFFKGKDLELPTGAEVNTVELLKKLVKSFGKIVPYKTLDENSADTASDFLRGKIRTIKIALQKHKVPCTIKSKKWTGYLLINSRTHS